MTKKKTRKEPTKVDVDGNENKEIWIEFFDYMGPHLGGLRLYFLSQSVHIDM